jgi:GNAT superfamily N-acetyltransferase
VCNSIHIEHLAKHPECLPLLQAWFEREWASYYGAGGVGNAAADLRGYANTEALPVGIVAFCNQQLCGVAALKADSIASRSALGPWAGAGFVHPSFRRRGVGARLLAGIEDIARELGYQSIYCATSTSASLLERNAWRLMEHITHDGARIAIYEKVL